MPYDHPRRKTYSFNAISFASADSARVIKNPGVGLKARVRAISAMVTTTCAGATTTPKVQVGDGTTVNKFADLALGTTAAGGAVVAKDYASGMNSLNPSGNVLGAKDADLTVTFKAATGSGAAGVADVAVEVEWI